MIFDKTILEKIRESSQDELQYEVGSLLRKLGVPRISKQGDLPDNGPVLVISNHKGVFDTLVLFSNIDRKDYYFVALSTYGIFGSQVQKRVLPIYRKRQLNHRIYEYPLSLQITGAMPPKLANDEIRGRNRQTVARAAKLVNEGNVVSVFPTGSVGKVMPGSEWKPGVGYLVKQVKNPKTKIVFAKIIGTKQSDLVAYLRPLIRRLMFRPKPISITFSEPYLLDELVSKADEPKKIAKDLEKHYKKSFVI